MYKIMQHKKRKLYYSMFLYNAVVQMETPQYISDLSKNFGKSL